MCDFYCHEIKLVIEIDGIIHNYNQPNDKLRDSIMKILGLNILRIENEEIENSISQVIDKIKNSITDLENKLTHPKSLSSKERDF